VFQPTQRLVVLHVDAEERSVLHASVFGVDTQRSVHQLYFFSSLAAFWGMDFEIFILLAELHTRLAR